MSNLPCELLDHIVDLLYNSQTFGRIPPELRDCSLVSKSWVPRTRRHLFADIYFQTAKRLESWKKAFPDPSTSPACYAKLLWIGGPRVVTAEGAEVGWIRSFSGVEHLELGGQDVDDHGWEVAFALFHGFSPAIKSLRMKMSPLPFRHFFDLVLSFPLLEDLNMADCQDVPTDDHGGDSDGLSVSTSVQSSSLPVFTGTLDLHLDGGPVGPVVHWLLSSPGGIHFRKLTFSWFREEDVSLTMALMGGCSHTLESLHVCSDSYGGPKSASFSLSKATRLRDVVFRLGSRRVEWVTLALQTVGHEHRDLQRISVEAPPFLTIFPTSISTDVKQAVGEGIFGQWSDLDRFLVHLQESRSICTSVMRPLRRRKSGFFDCIGHLLPEVTKSGMIERGG